MKLPVKALDSGGHIVGQPFLGEIPYGRSDAAKSGCGFISVWNLLLILGRPVPKREVWSAMQRALLMSGHWGTRPFALRRALGAYGIKTRLTLLPRRAAKAAEKADAGIILYAHKKGMHYVAYERTAGGENTFRFYNVSAPGGARSTETTVEGFISAYSRFPIVFNLTVI